MLLLNSGFALESESHITFAELLQRDGVRSNSGIEHNKLVLHAFLFKENRVSWRCHRCRRLLGAALASLPKPSPTLFKLPVYLHLGTTSKWSAKRNSAYLGFFQCHGSIFKFEAAKHKLYPLTLNDNPIETCFKLARNAMMQKLGDRRAILRYSEPQYVVIYCRSISGVECRPLIKTWWL